MLKRFLMKQAMKSQLKGVPETEQDALLDLIERNPEFFENLAKELQEGLKSGKNQQAVMMELMTKHREKLSEMMKK
ncbi:MAG TPA: hypothetical protein VFT82_02045 [Candidatus Paceibacterota bacterium]|nr:hypothetical protein [Candidatus Paceibacterota bacterium]